MGIIAMTTAPALEAMEPSILHRAYVFWRDERILRS
jgi:hypothetical protein